MRLLKKMFLLMFTALLCLGECEVFRTNDSREITHRVGYIGPACAVVDDVLFLHGTSVRKLTEEELGKFIAYQNNLTLFNRLYESQSENQFRLADAVSASPNTTPAVIHIPMLPSFCDGLDDSVEVVLNGCTVRDNRVFISGKLIRPLNNLERQKINAVVRSQSPSAFRQRRKRENNEKATEPQNDIASLLNSLLNVNTSVAQRFLPFAKSPIFSDVNTTALDQSQISEAINQVIQHSNKSGALTAALTAHPDVEKEYQLESLKKSLQQQTTFQQQQPTLPEELTTPQEQSPEPSSSSTAAYSPASFSQETRPPLEAASNEMQFVIPVAQTGLKPGDTTIIGGQQYVVVPVSGYSSLSQGAIVNNMIKPAGGTGSLPQWPPGPQQNSLFSVLTQGTVVGPSSTVNPPIITFIPAKVLPHEICRAHIVDAFQWWIRTQRSILNA